jgi:glucose-1-phosphate cytidylyltransferase
MIKEYFLNYEAMNNDFTIGLGQRSQIRYNAVHEEQGFQVTLADTGLNTMTGGRLKRIQKYIDGDTFMLTYGDGLADINMLKLLEFHKSHGKLATVTAVLPPSRYGILQIERAGKVDKFLEKPRTESFASAGFFVLQRGVFDYLGGDDCIFEQEPLSRLSADGQLMAYQHDGFFYSMDTYREYQYLNDLWGKQEAPWKVW